MANLVLGQHKRAYSTPDGYRSQPQVMMSVRSSIGVMAICLTLGGCADGAKLIQHYDAGGIVIYPFKDGQGPMLSSFRDEALDLMKEQCRGRSYNIVREGETKGRTRVVSPLDGAQELVEERRWGIQFECK